MSQLPARLVRPPRSATPPPKLPREVIDLLAWCEEAIALDALRARAGMEPAVFEQVIRKLLQLGLLTADISDEEEAAFFARSIDHLLEPEERATDEPGDTTMS